MPVSPSVTSCKSFSFSESQLSRTFPAYKWALTPLLCCPTRELWKSHHLMKVECNMIEWSYETLSGIQGNNFIFFLIQVTFDTSTGGPKKQLYANQCFHKLRAPHALLLKWKYDPHATWAYILQIKWVWVKKNGFRSRPQHFLAIWLWTDCFFLAYKVGITAFCLPFYLTLPASFCGNRPLPHSLYGRRTHLPLVPATCFLVPHGF